MEEKIKIIAELFGEITRHNMKGPLKTIRLDIGGGLAQKYRNEITFSITGYERDGKGEARIDWNLWIYEDLKKTSISELKKIAERVRKYMRENV